MSGCERSEMTRVRTAPKERRFDLSYRDEVR